MPLPPRLEHSRCDAPRRYRRLCQAGLLALGLVLAGCGTLPRNALPAAAALDGQVPGFPEVRGWAFLSSSTLEQDLVRSFTQESPQDFPPDATGTVRYAHLALSGGGANGAFGSGFLSGWTATGTRPVFKIVTGVSTGALMAPFAFIGPPYDQALREFYTTTSSRDIFLLGSTFGLLWQLMAGEALADTRPLQADDRAPCRRAAAAARGRSPPARPAPVHRHRLPRRAALRGLEHGVDRQQRPSRRAGAVPQGDAGLGLDPGGLPAGVLRGRAHARRAALRRDACRRRRRRARVPQRRRVPRLGDPRTRRSGRRRAGRTSSSSTTAS